MKVPARFLVAALSISTAAFAGWKSHEGFSSHAVIPTKGDVPTIGHGSTYYENGQRVKMGDTITPKRADELAMNLLNRDGREMAASLPGVKMTQGEYDVYIDYVGQFGMGNFRSSGMRRDLLAGRHVAACHDLLNYRFAAGYDCSTPGNHRCIGVWKRQQERYSRCMAAQ